MPICKNLVQPTVHSGQSYEFSPMILLINIIYLYIDFMKAKDVYFHLSYANKTNSYGVNLGSDLQDLTSVSCLSRLEL